MLNLLLLFYPQATVQIPAGNRLDQLQLRRKGVDLDAFQGTLFVVA